MPNEGNFYLSSLNREERKRMMEELEALNAEQNEAFIQDIMAYQKYLQELKALDRAMDELSELDSWGLPKTLSAEDKTALEQQMLSTAQAGEAFLSDIKNIAQDNKDIELNKGVPAMVGKLQGLLSHDYTTVQAYDPSKKQLSLPALMEESRTKTIMLGKKQIESMHGAQSSRIPMSLVNEKGRIRSGFLTKGNKLEVMSVYQSALHAAANEAGTRQMEEQWEGLLQKYRDYKKIGADKGDEYVIAHMVAATFDKKSASASEINFKVLLHKMGVPATGLGKRAITKFVDKLQPLNTIGTAFAAIDLQLKEGQRIDTRNSAMSAAADFLGRPDLVARATDVKFIDGDGEVLEGTFMDFADGLDLGSGKKRYFQQISDDPFGEKAPSAKPGAFLKDIADIQAIDYICGNLDRHFANLMYRVDENGRLIGIKAIDNDTSLGSNLPGGENHQRLAGTNNMGVISESMATQIKNMTPEMLRFRLRGKNLSEEQLDFAALRLEQLKTAILEGEQYYKDKPIGKGQVYDEGHLRKVADKDFASLKIEQMCSEEKDALGWSKNLYGEVRTKMKERLYEARKNGASFVPKDRRVPDDTKLEKVDTADKTLSEKLTIKAMEEPIHAIGNYINFPRHWDKDIKKAKTIDELTHRNNGSPQFAEMVSAVKHLAALQKHFNQLKEAGKELTLQEYKQYHSQLKGALKDVSETQEAYLNFKMGEKKVEELDQLRGKNEYEQNRIRFAKNVRQFVNRAVKNANKLENPDSFAIDPAEIRAQEMRRDLEEQEKAMEELRKIHEAHGLAAPETIVASRKGRLNDNRAAADSFQKQVIEKSKEAANKPKPPAAGL